MNNNDNTMNVERDPMDWDHVETELWKRHERMSKEESTMKQINSAVVIAKKWFDRVNGNTYHSTRIIINGVEADFKKPFEYGYGDAYMDTAATLAIENGYSHDDMDRNALRCWLKSNAIVDVVNVKRSEM